MSLETREDEGLVGRYRAILDRVHRAAARSGRQPEDVVLIAVSKEHSVSAIETLVRAGCLDFGENRVKDWAAKQAVLPRRIRWHFIGHLQRNKVKSLVDEVCLIHSIDSVGLIEALEQRASAPHDVLIEVNVGAEPQKSGVLPKAALDLCVRAARSPITRPVGLMCIPPQEETVEAVRVYYRALAQLGGAIRGELISIDEDLGAGFVHLSMGMSDDFEVAIEEGATLVRVGTSIFGPRPLAAT